MAFNRDFRGGPRRNFDRPRRDHGSDRGRDRQMHQAVCSNCGKDCQVPFKPTGEKPIYCSECFEKNNGNSARRSGGGDRFQRKQSFGDRDNRPNNNNVANENSAKLDELNSKLDKILKLLNTDKQAVVPSVIQKSQEKVEIIKKPVKRKTIIKKLVPSEETIIASEVDEETVETKNP